MQGISEKEKSKTGADAPDFVIVTGDIYIDHPSIGAAVIRHVLENSGYSVGVISRPDASSTFDFARFGRPRLAFLITAGSVDSMVANYTANKRRRRNLLPIPDRACIIYTNRCKECYKDVPVILGGIEASLRRLAHYDYWSDKVRRSILLDSKADILVYGMGERAVCEIASALNDGFGARDITWIHGTVFRAPKGADGANAIPANAVRLPSFSQLTSPDMSESDRLDAYMDSFVIANDNTEAKTAMPLAEEYDGGVCIIQNPPQPPLSTPELDAVYDLPFTYDLHPYFAGKLTDAPGLGEMRFSIAHVRGCFGGCAFCAITQHQGRIPTARSIESVVREAEKMAAMPEFKGYIHDVGGPTANIYGPACEKQKAGYVCKDRNCLYPSVCSQLDADHGPFLEMLNAIAHVGGVKKVFIRSGIRHDLVMADKKNGKRFIRELAKNHVSGLLKTAPEHFMPGPLTVMRKPCKEVYDDFCREFARADEAAKHPARQYILPYFICGHPGSNLRDAYDLMRAIEKSGSIVPDQIQDFYPTPATLATCIYYTGKDPYTREAIHVPGKDSEMPNERALQRALMHHKKPENRNKVRRALEILDKLSQ